MTPVDIPAIRALIKRIRSESNIADRPDSDRSHSMNVVVVLDNGRGYEFDGSETNRAILEESALSADRAKRRGGRSAAFISRGGVPDNEHDAAVMDWWRTLNGRENRSPDVAVPTRRLSKAERYEQQQFIRDRLGLAPGSLDQFDGRA